MPSHLYYCRKAAEVLKPYGILALIVPQSFLSDDFTDKAAISEMETAYRFLGQIALPSDSFSQMGVSDFPTKLQFWQRRPAGEEKEIQPYRTEPDGSLKTLTDLTVQAEAYYEKLLRQARANLDRNRSHIFLELARIRNTSADFQYRVQKLLYHIKVHPSTRERYTKCCEYLHRFYTEKQPPDMDYQEWSRVRLTEKKVFTYLTAALKRQNTKPEQDKIALVKQNDCFLYKAYSAKTRRQLTPAMRQSVPVYEAVLDNAPEQFPGFNRLLRKSGGNMKHKTCILPICRKMNPLPSGYPCSPSGMRKTKKSSA